MKQASGFMSLKGLGVFFVLMQMANAFVVLPYTQTGLSIIGSNGQVSLQASLVHEETQKLLEKAQKLRQEADALESQLREERGPVVTMTAPEPKVPAVRYEDMAGSTWEIKYRFADEPVKDRDEDLPLLEFYRGTLNVLFRNDGYSEIVAKDDSDNSVKVVKLWGWDEELSQEDGKRYILFSMDAQPPGKQQKQRFYFQALLERERNAIILKEGTVTIKEDLAESKKMMGFGFFSAKGILAQFRYVGEFAAKPIEN